MTFPAVPAHGHYCTTRVRQRLPGAAAVAVAWLLLACVDESESPAGGGAGQGGSGAGGSVGAFTETCSAVRDLSPSGRNEDELVRAAIPAALAGDPFGGEVDANCRVGRNSPDFTDSGAQRGALDRLLSGVFTGNLDYIEDGVCAVEEAFRHQQPDGTMSDPTGDGDAFLMAWLNHALWVLRDSPYWTQVGTRPAERNYGGGTFSTRIDALLPSMLQTMDYLAARRSALASHHAFSPNRTMIVANAFAFASLLFEGAASDAQVASYRTEAEFWLDNFVDRQLLRDLDGVVAEAVYSGNPAPGYDTGYHGTTLWMLSKLAIHFESPIADGCHRVARATRWLELRILPDGTADCTYNTRSGPNNQVGDDKPTNFKELTRALWYASVYLGPSDQAESAAALAAAERINRSEMNGLPPVVFSPPVTTGRRGEPFEFFVLATNAGATALAPDFVLDASGLPDGLSLGPLEYLKSTGYRAISGTPEEAGDYGVEIRASNEFGDGRQSLTISVEP